MDQQTLEQIQQKLETLMLKNNAISKEIEELRNEITGLNNPSPVVQKTIEPIIHVKDFVTAPPVIMPKTTSVKDEVEKVKNALADAKRKKGKSDFEKFIGENLLNKIGIIIMVIGVAIGAKYAIDHQLISPLTRIILGYLVGAGLMIFAIRLKKDYEQFSAVLLSGSMAIMYFLTFAAYSYYSLFPQLAAFIIMLVFTVFTVIAALNYNQVIIAQIGLVGAYAIPFLLSNGEGNVTILLSYMTILNCGILAIAFKKYWKSLYLSSFVITWIILAAWLLDSYDAKMHFITAIIFIHIFFLVFYLTFLIYKLKQKEKFKYSDIALLLSNSFIAYLLGYYAISENNNTAIFTGLYTLVHGILHFAVCVIVYKNKSADRSLFFLVAGLVLTFITICIPVQFNGFWVSVMWSCEAAILFWIGRTRNVVVYEYMSYPLIILSFFSIFQDWNVMYSQYNPEIKSTRIFPLINFNMLVSLIVIGAFGWITRIQFKITSAVNNFKNIDFPGMLNYVMPSMLAILIYTAFRLEITVYWDQLFEESIVTVKKSGLETYDSVIYNFELQSFKSIWIINYSLFFLSILAFLNIYKIRNKVFAWVNLVLMGLFLFIFISEGLMLLRDLQDVYLEQRLSEYYPRGINYIVIRYISLIFPIVTLYGLRRYIQSGIIDLNLKIVYDAVLYFSILCLISSELIHWMDMSRLGGSFKLSLSILWGAYSLFIVIIGLRKGKKHLRVGAIGLFGITLIKLFIYDISYLNTIAKTIVFVSLGLLLLVISFLYNKNKKSTLVKDHE